MYVYGQLSAIKDLYILYHIVLYNESMHFKKTMLIENLIKIFTKTHELHTFFSKFSRRVACPYMCVADISI